MHRPPLRARLVAGLLVFAADTPSLHAQRQSADSVAADSAQRLAPVFTRATRSAQSSFGSPLAITRLDRETFAGRSGFGLNDALWTTPGALVQSRYGTADVRISIRGFGSRGAGDRSNAGTSRGIRVLLDGFPETEPDGRTSLDNVDLALVESIDVIRSNAGSLWGNAAGGVVSLSSVPAVDAPFATGQYMSGSFGLQRYIAQAGAPVGRGVAYATFANTTYEGWRANSDARRTLVNAGLATPIGEHTQLRAHLLAANNLMHLPGPLSAAQAADDPEQANATYNTRDERRYNRLGRLGVAVEHEMGGNSSISFSTYVNPKYLQRSERGTFRDFTRYHFGGNAQYNRFDRINPGFANRVTVGIDQAYQDGAILFYSLTAAGTRGTTLSDNKKEGAYNSGAYLEDELFFGERVSLTLGARADAIAYYNKSFIRPRIDASKRFEQITPKVGIAFRASPTRVYYANVGGGVEAPAGNETDPASTFGQDSVTSINPLLEPIRSTTYEVGTKHARAIGDGTGMLAGISYDVAGYLTNVTNEIVPYRGGRFYFTAGKARRVGGELGLNARFRGGVRLENALTISRNTYEQYVVDSVHYQKPNAFADFSGNRIVGVPNYFYGSKLVIAPARAPLGLAVQAGVQGTGRYFADDANTVTVPESHIVNLSVRAERLLAVGGARLAGFVTVENAADRRWIGSAFLNPDVVSGVPLAYEPGMPRSVLVSFQVTRGR